MANPASKRIARPPRAHVRSTRMCRQVMNTIPTNELSYLRVTEMRRVNNGHALAWPCATDRVHAVQYSLPGGWIPVAGMTNLVPAGTWLMVTNPPDGSILRFYRLRVRLP